MTRQPVSCHPHHPGPPGHASGGQRTAVPPPAAPGHGQRGPALPRHLKAPLALLPQPSWAPSGALSCLRRVLIGVHDSEGLPVLTWGTSETRPWRLSSVSGTASTLGPVCSCTCWLVTKAQTMPTLWDGAEEGAYWMLVGTWTSPPLPPGLGAPHSSTRVVSSRKVMSKLRSQATSLCSIFARPPRRRWPRQQ